MTDNTLLTPLTDNADWRLVIRISASNLKAYLKNSADSDAPLRLVADTDWNSDNDADTLNAIQNAVYASPAMLDDYEADIILEADNCIFVPEEAIEAPGDAEFLYSKVFKADEEDIYIDRFNGIACLYRPVEGLKSFTDRTFPGARVASALSTLICHFRDQATDNPRIYVHIREGKADIMAFDKRNLLCAATHPWHNPEDIVYYTLLTCNATGIDAAEANVRISGKKDVRPGVVESLRKVVASASFTIVPRIADAAGLPLEAALCIQRKHTGRNIPTE